MAFEPKISVCLTDKCKTLKATDVTGVYHVTSNPTGWQNAATVLASEVATATITITDPAGTTTITDVLTQIPDPVIGNFTFSDLTLANSASWADGDYTILYTIVTIPGAANPGTYTATICPYFFCNIECSVDKMWAKVATNLCCSDCDASELMEVAMVAEGYLRALKSAASCGDTTSADILLKTLTKITTFNDCNCN